LTNSVYALDSTTIDLCLSAFPWAHFRTTKPGVKRRTLLDLRGKISSFIHVSDRKLADVNALDLLVAEATASLKRCRCPTRSQTLDGQLRTAADRSRFGRRRSGWLVLSTAQPLR
jgi:hypothetical protein